MLVFVAHAGLERYVPGGLGVTIFFFLSGYLITTLLRTEWDKNGTINFGHFWLRRALRILPPFYLVLIAATLLTQWLQGVDSISLPSIAALAFHYVNYWIIFHGYDGLPSGTGVYWSLAVEEHFYVVFPWTYWLLRTAKVSAVSQAMFLWGCCVLVLLWRLYLVLEVHSPVYRTYMATDTRVDSILFGCALAVWHNPTLDRVELTEHRWKLVYLPLALLLLLATIAIRGDVFRETLRYSLQGIALTIIFIAAIRFSMWPIFRPLNVRPVVFVGLLSYSLYLLHYAALASFEGLLPAVAPVLRAVLVFLVCLAIAWVIYVAVEKPCARLRRRLSE